MPTDDPVPRTKPRRTTADSEARPLAANGPPPTAAPSGETAANGAGPPSVRPRPLPDDESDARIDDFLGAGPEPTKVPERRLERKSGPDDRALRRRKAMKPAIEQRTQHATALVGPLGAEALTAPEAALIAPPGRRARRADRRLRARRVHRLVRHIEPWSILKLALVFYFCLWVIMLVTGVILWRVAVSSGVIDNIEGFIESLLVLDNFKFNGGELFRAYAVGGLLMVLIATGFTVLATVLFNLISDLIGGVRITVIQEETARPNDRERDLG
ncbi:MAG: hypothetical protein E6G39_07930 [Actinobacteria bacterium]|nr:MAG: hypothetical protein E6G39_07930 [Actinomycetota bacterium]